jgi:predicted hydrocarbon binding protein
MRQTLNLLKQRARDPQNINKVKFQEILPLKLKNSVSGKSDSESNVACLQEMTILLACMKKNDFNEPLCNKEIGTFQNCYTSFLDKSFAMKKTQNKGILTPGKNLNYKQLNKFLKLHPNPK